MTRCLALAIALAFATTAFGGTPQEAYEKLWSKRAIDVTVPGAAQKPKAACVCMDGGAYNGRWGTLAKSGASGFCGVPTQFDVNGAVVVLTFCYTFEYIK